MYSSNELLYNHEDRISLRVPSFFERKEASRCLAFDKSLVNSSQTCRGWGRKRYLARRGVHFAEGSRKTSIVTFSCAPGTTVDDAATSSCRWQRPSCQRASRLIIWLWLIWKGHGDSTETRATPRREGVNPSRIGANDDETPWNRFAEGTETRCLNPEQILWEATIFFDDKTRSSGTAVSVERVHSLTFSCQISSSLRVSK